MIVKLLSFILVAYVALEGLSALAAVPGGKACLCHKVKYLFAIAVSVSFLEYAWAAHVDPFAVAFLIVVACFVLPRTLWRFQNGLVKIP